MSRKIIFFIAAWLSAFSVHAAELTIIGAVLEKGTRKPMHGVVVSVMKQDQMTADQLSAVSDAKGRFQLTLPDAGSYILSATNYGMTAALEVRIAANEPLPSPTLYLLVPETLGDIVVTARRNPDKISNNSISGKTVRQIAGSSGDPLTALQSLPGVATVDGTSAPAVRGSGPGDNLYYVDDLRVNSLFHFGGLSLFNADLIDSFDLYSAAFSPNYGNISGSVIDVTLREPRTDRLGGKVNVNFNGADFLIEGPSSSNQSFYFAARRSYFDLLVKEFTQNGVTLQIPNYSDYQGKYLWQVNDRNRITFHLQGASDILKFRYASTTDVAQQQPVLAGNSSLTDVSTMQGIVLDTVLTGASVNTLSFEHLSDHAITAIGTAGTSDIMEDNLLLRQNLSMNFDGGNELSLGGDAVNTTDKVDVNTRNAPCSQFNPNCNLNAAPRLQLSDTITSNALGISAQDRQRILSDLTLVGGVRYSYEDYAHKTYTEPRVGIEWELTKSTLFTAGWGKHNQPPNSAEWVRVFGNPNLDHIRAEDTVIGLQHKVNADWSWKTETYYKKLSNLVVNDPLLNYINAASGKAYGLELQIKKEPTDKLSGWFVINLSKSERHNNVTGEAFRYEYDQPINTTLIGNYKLSDAWSFGMKWAYHSGTPYTPIIGTNGAYADGSAIPVYARVNSGTLPVYHRLDLRLDRKFVFNKWKLNHYIELNNVYQRNNIVGYTYNGTYTTRDPVNSSVMPISIGIQAEF